MQLIVFRTKWSWWHCNGRHHWPVSGISNSQNECKISKPKAHSAKATESHCSKVYWAPIIWKGLHGPYFNVRLARRHINNEEIEVLASCTQRTCKDATYIWKGYMIWWLKPGDPQINVCLILFVAVISIFSCVWQMSCRFYHCSMPPILARRSSRS